jgi:hypothetical protein
MGAAASAPKQIKVDCNVETGNPDPQCWATIRTMCATPNLDACARRLATIDPNNDLLMSVCQQLASEGKFPKVCLTKMQAMKDVEDASYRFSYCAKALATTNTLPVECDAVLTPQQKEKMLSDACSKLGNKIKDSPACRTWCLANADRCVDTVRGYCKDPVNIAGDPFCTAALSDKRMWGKLDDVLPTLCQDNTMIRNMELCNCMNDVKLRNFISMFKPSEIPRVKAECHMPDCINKKVYRSGAQTSPLCGEVCHDGELAGSSNITKCAVAPAAVHCKVGEWGAWGACEPSCGVSVRKRRRDVLVEASNGGLSCPPLEESQVCVDNSACKSSPLASSRDVSLYGVGGLLVLLVLVLLYRITR